MRAFFVSVALLLGLVLVGEAQQRSKAPANPAPQAARPKAEATVPFTVGETLNYDVSWGRFLVAATATTRVSEKRASYGSVAYSVTAEGRPIPLVARLYPLFYKIDSLVDTYSLVAQWSSLYVESGTSKRLASTRFDRNAHRAHYEIADEPGSKVDFAVAPTAQDGLTAMYALRARGFRQGDRLTVPIVSDGSLYTATFSTGAQEKVTVPFGTVSAWKVAVGLVDAAGAPAGADIAVWFSSDARRLPVRIEADLPLGTFALVLRTAN